MARIVEVGCPKRPKAIPCRRNGGEPPENELGFALFLVKLKTFFSFLIWLLCLKRFYTDEGIAVSEKSDGESIITANSNSPASRRRKHKMYHQALSATDSGNQSAANSDDLSSNASSSDCLATPPESKTLSSCQMQDELVMNFRCLQRQGSSGNLLQQFNPSEMTTPTKPYFPAGNDVFTTPPRYPLRPSSSLSQLSCIEGSPAPTVKTVIDKSACLNSSATQHQGSIPPTKSPLIVANTSTSGRLTGSNNRTLGDMEREMAEMQKTIVDLRLRLELYYEQSRGKLTNSSDAEVRKMAVALEEENKSLKEKIEQLETDLQRALETYPQLVAELNAARSKMAYMQKQMQVPTASSATLTDLPIHCSKCEEKDFEKSSLSSVIEQLQKKDYENQSKIIELQSENTRLIESLKIENEKWEKAKTDLEATEKSKMEQIASVEERLNDALESEKELRQKVMADCQKRLQFNAEKVAALTKELEELRLHCSEETYKKSEEITVLQRDLAAKEDLLKTHKQTSLWEIEELKRRFCELESSKREEIALLENKLRSLAEQCSGSSKQSNSDDCDLGLPRSASSPVSTPPDSANSNSIVAQLFDQNKDAMMSAMGSELQRLAKQLQVRDKAILGLTKQIQQQNIQVAEDFKSMMSDLKCNFNEKGAEFVQATTTYSQHTQVEEGNQQRCEYFLKLLHVLQLSDDEAALKNKIAELESAVQQEHGGDYENDEVLNDALLQVQRRIEVLKVLNRFLNGELALACNERDRILSEETGEMTVSAAGEQTLIQHCTECDALKIQCAHWVGKYRRLKKDFRTLWKTNVQSELAAGNFQSICKKCELVNDEYRTIIEQKDRVIERLIADLATLDKSKKLSQNQHENIDRKSNCAESNECSASPSRSRSSLPHSASRGSSRAMRPVSSGTIPNSNDGVIGDLHKYLPKLWKRLGKLRSFISSLFTELKVYEAVISPRLQQASNGHCGSAISINSDLGSTLASDLKTLRTLGCRMTTAMNETIMLEANVRALEKRCLRRCPNFNNNGNNNKPTSEKQQHPNRRCESVSPCRRCNNNNCTEEQLYSSSPNNETDQSKFEMSELFAEIQTLKDQLQRAIQTNAALKSKLEEQVSGSSSNAFNSLGGSVAEINTAVVATSSSTRPLQLGSKRGANSESPKQQQDMLSSPPGSDDAPSVAEYNDNLMASPSKPSAEKQSASGSNERVHSAGRLSSGSPAARNFSASPSGQNQNQSSPSTNRSGHCNYNISRKATYGSVDGLANKNETSPRHLNRRSATTLASERLTFAGNQRTRGSSARPTNASSPNAGSPPTNGHHIRSASSDLRAAAAATPAANASTLYAVGRLEEFEHLKREIEESFAVLRTLENKVKARLAVLIHQQQQHDVKCSRAASPALHALAASESLHLKELQLSTSELRVCLNQQKQLTNQFSVNQLPPVNARGKYVDVELLSENTCLIDSVSSWKSKYEAAERLLRQMQERLEQRNRAKEVVESALYSKLANHEEVLQQVRSNLQRTYTKDGLRQIRAGGVVVKTPLPDKHNLSPKR